MIDALGIRTRIGFTQHKMADVIGTTVADIRKWETGHGHPSGPAFRILVIMDREPEAVLRALQ